MIRENPKTGVLEESDVFGLVFSPVINDSGKMTRKDPDTGIKEESGMLDWGWNPVINDSGKMTRSDPDTGELQQSGPFNLWWEGASSDSGVGNRPSIGSSASVSASPLSTSSSSSGSNNYSSDGGSSVSGRTNSSTALSVLKPPSEKVARGVGVPESGRTLGSRLETVAVVIAAVGVGVIMGSLIEAMFTDKNVIKRLPPVDPPPSSAPVMVLLAIASLLAAAFFLTGIGMGGGYPRFDLTTAVGGGIATTICVWGWFAAIRNKRDEMKKYWIAVKKRENENRLIDEQNEAYRKKKAVSKK